MSFRSIPNCFSFFACLFGLFGGLRNTVVGMLPLLQFASLSERPREL